MVRHAAKGNWQLGLFLALSTGILWGFLPISLRIVLAGLDVFTTTWVRFLIAASLLAIILYHRKSWPKYNLLSKTPVIFLMICALSLALNYFLYLYGLRLISPGTTQLILQLAPLFFSFGALIIFKERFSFSQLCGVLIMVIGFYFFFNDQIKQLLMDFDAYLWGCLLCFLAAILWAIYALLQKQLLTDLSSQQIMLFIYLFCTVFFFPTAHPEQVLDLSRLQVINLIFVALNTLLAYGAFAEAVNQWDASRVSAVLAITPLLTFLFMYFVQDIWPQYLDKEVFSLSSMLGALLVVSGSLVTALANVKRS